ncbi:MAG: recombination mediator RecR [Prosthecobacter sp.]|uniref:recombination mediator RecR n=1 Tax=Prosthecobacter sp. TaxID=1965333 RepID=UPI003903800C
MRIDYPPAIQRLVAQLKSLPGLGPRSAERLMLWLLQSSNERITSLAHSLNEAKERIVPCSDCGFFIESDGECLLCRDPRRQQRLLCVVEQAADVLRLERSGAFQGLYHVLGGRLSPLDNVTPEDLRMESLVHRVRDLHTEEVIIALGSDVEGEATASYIADLLRPAGIAVTRLAQGMPAGGNLDHVDELTLYQALHGRRQMG